MPEDVLFDHEQRTCRERIASYLKTVVDERDAGGAATLQAGTTRSLSPHYHDPPSR